MLATMTPQQILSFYGVEDAYTQAPVIFYHHPSASKSFSLNQMLGVTLITIALGAALAAIYPFLQLELGYQWISFQEQLAVFAKGQTQTAASPTPLPLAPEFNPLVDPKGNPITPVNRDFSLVIPAIGVNAAVIPGVNPASKPGYTESLTKGVGHASTSFYPNENGTVYLFSHSTNYEWFVKDLNAVFYLLKNLEPGDAVVVMYLGDRYTYRIREKKVVKAREVGYLQPQAGIRSLVLQTCWPPGSSYERLLIFADLYEAKHYGNFDEVINGQIN